MHAPLTFEWTGEEFKPLPRFARRCDEQFVVGERYTLEIIEERSYRSHKHYFSVVNEYWKNLPERIAPAFPSADHLRSFALIRCGYYHQRTITVKSQIEAERVAAFVKPMSEFGIVTVEGCVVNVFTAESQSYRTMDKARFQASKQSVLEFLAELVGVEPAQVAAEADQAA